MKTINTLLIFCVFYISTSLNAQTRISSRLQSGYYRQSTRTFVQPHYKTYSNKTNTDNYSTSGNINTYTGSHGMRAADYSSKSYNYGSGKSISTGKNGGQYYNNNSGKRTYVPKR